MEYFVIALGLATGNFIFQAGGDKKWDFAIEISLYQAVAVLSVWIAFEFFTRTSSCR